MKRGKKKMFYKKIGKSIVRMLKTAYVPTVLAVTHRTFWTTRSLHDQEGSHWVHEKEVTQTEIHKGQHEWDRISAYSSFYMARLLYRKKKKPNPQKTQPCSLLSHSVFETALWKSSNMDFQSESQHHTSKPSTCTRHHSSSYQKHSEELLIFQSIINSSPFFSSLKQPVS